MGSGWMLSDGRLRLALVLHSANFVITMTSLILLSGGVESLLKSMCAPQAAQAERLIIPVGVIMLSGL
jgi:hypothetical protein